MNRERTAGKKSVTLAVAVATFLPAASFYGCDDSQKRFVAASNQAVEALEHEDYTRAETALTEALQIVPTDADALYYMGTIHTRRQKPKEAAEFLTRAVQAEPTFADAWLHLAKARFDLKDYKGTAEAVAALLKLDPGHPNAHMLEARLALVQTPPDRVAADKALRAAISGDAGFAPAYVLLSQLYGDVEAFESARDVLSEGQRFAPQSVEIQEALGLTWLDLGRPDRAKAVLAAAAAHPKARPGVHLNYAAALLQLGEKEGAIQALRAFILQSQGTEKAGDAAVQTATRMLRHLKGS